MEERRATFTFTQDLTTGKTQFIGNCSLQDAHKLIQDFLILQLQTQPKEDSYVSRNDEEQHSPGALGRKV